MSNGCATQDGPPHSVNRDWQQIADAVPKDEPRSKYGNPQSYVVFGKRYQVRETSKGFVQTGIASWYGSKFHGERTSSGETYDMHAMTAAHKTLPLPCYVEVTNADNGRKAIVKVNDRGPFHEGRIIDLSYAAATRLGVAQTGTANVSIRVVTPETVSQAPAVASTTGTEHARVNTAQAAPVVAASAASYVDDQGKIYVQVAAYTSEAAALKVMNELREQNFNDLRIHVENSKQQTFYRVRIGPLPTPDVAEKLLVQLKEIRHDNARIVTYN